MKKSFFTLLAILLLCVTSCSTNKTAQKIIYLQDVQPGSSIPTEALSTLTIVPGDKLGITVTSIATPDLAALYNLNLGASNNSSTNNADNTRYTVDENGCVDILGIGRVKVSGLTRSEAAAKIQTIFREGVVNDAVVTVAAYNRCIYVLGEVNKPGRQEITRDNITILEAIGMAGDLTIQGRRDNIKVIRREGNESKAYFVDLRQKESVFNSPVYNLRQDDVIIVEPNKVRIGQSTNNDNALRSISTWISISSLLTSIATLIIVNTQ